MNQDEIQVFISYAREDEESALQVYYSLRSYNVVTWIDCNDIQPGAKWEEEIQKALEASSFVIFLSSINSITKKGYLQKEIKYALKLAEERDIVIIPVRLDQSTPHDKMLKKLQFIDLFPGFKPGIRAIQNTIYHKLNSLPPPPVELILSLQAEEQIKKKEYIAAAKTKLKLSRICRSQGKERDAHLLDTSAHELIEKAVEEQEQYYEAYKVLKDWASELRVQGKERDAHLLDIIQNTIYHKIIELNSHQEPPQVPPPPEEWFLSLQAEEQIKKKEYIAAAKTKLKLSRICRSQGKKSDAHLLDTSAHELIEKAVEEQEQYYEAYKVLKDWASELRVQGKERDAHLLDISAHHYLNLH